MFNCNGKVNSNDWRINKSSSFIRNEIENVIFTSQDSLFLGDIMLFGSVLPSATAALDLKHLGMCIEMKLKLLSRQRAHDFLSYQKPAHDQPDFYSARKDIYECVAYVRSYLNSIKWDSEVMKNVENLVGEDFEDLLLGLNMFLRGLKGINDSVFHYAASNQGNESLQPDFHLYHLHLELRWLNLTLLHAKECPESYATQDTEALFSLGDVNVSSQSFSLDTTMAGIVDDLIYIAMKLFERIPLADLRTKTPYSCTCAKELWLMLQIFIDDLAAKRKSKIFWQYVNNSLNTRIGATGPEASTSWNNNDGYNNSIDCKNPEMFCLWLIYHLALLYGYNMDTVYSGVSSARIQPNYVQVEKILKVYVERGGKAGERDEIDEELGGMIPLLTTLTCEWWQPRVQIVSLLWDCFHRRLDLPFLLQATGPWQASIDKKGPADILKQVRQRLEDNSEQNKLSSYGMFLRLLGIFLRKSMQANDSKHWNQMKGRIYSKFTKSKVEEFAEAGLYNFISLFITLALATNTFEVCTMMLDLLPNVLEDSRDVKSRIVIWKGELVVLLLFAEQKINFQKIPKQFLNEVDTISCGCCKDETSRLMMASYIDVLNEIFQSSDSMELSEHSLIGGWIGRYLLECSKARFNALITALNNVFDKCVNLRSLRPENNSVANGSSQMLEALWGNVAGSVRLLVLDSKTHGDCQSLTELAAKFTIEALRDPGMASRHGQSFSSLFKHFSSTLKVDVRTIRSYLALILPNQSAANELKKQKNSDVQVIQAWIKCCILGNDTPNKDSDYLTRYIIRSDEVTQTFTSRPDQIEIENSQIPIIPFIKAIRNQWCSLQTESGRLGLGKKCRTYFEHIEKWVTVPITEEAGESKLTFWIYQCIGTLISYCSPMLYVKNQPKSTLIDLINKFMLPPDETAWVMNIGKRIFPLVISGIGHLDVRSDIRLQSLINTLFDKYLPYLITESSNGDYKVSKSLLDCFQGNNINISRGIFEKLSANFITTCKDFSAHKNCHLVLFLLKDLVNRGKSFESSIIDLIISVCLPHVIILYMKVHNRDTHRQQTIDVIAALTRSPYYRESKTRREETMLLFTSMVQTCLVKWSEKLFEFMTSVCELIPELRPRVCLKIEQLLDNNKYKNSVALRFSLKQLKER